MSSIRPEEVAFFQENRPRGLLGAVLGDYRIQEEIGGQGGSQVFKAVSFDEASMFALKVFPADIAENREVLRQLVQSLRAAARIDHPGVPRVIGSGTIGSRPYIAMPYFPAGSMRDRLEMGLLSLSDLPVVLEEIASILTCAHRHGVVHGDLKPSEILYDADGHMKLIGLGQALDWLIDTSPPPRLETYKAPEVLLGQSPTPSADQYSFALISLEIATGDDAGEALRSIRAGSVGGGHPPSWQGRARASLPPRITEVLKRATDDDPGQRFPSVADMQGALLAALHDDPLPTVSPPTETPMASQPRRQRGLTLALLGMALALVLCVVTAFPAMSSPGVLDFDLARYTSLFVDALSGDIGGDSPTIASPISLSGKADPGGSTATPDAAGPPALSDLSEGPTSSSPTPLPGDGGEAPAEGSGSDNDSDADAGQPDTETNPGPTSTQPPEYTPAALPTNTPVPTAVATNTPVTVQPTDIPPTDPVDEPTINPNKCKSNPGHKNYCTPVP